MDVCECWKSIAYSPSPRCTLSILWKKVKILQNVSRFLLIKLHFFLAKRWNCLVKRRKPFDQKMKMFESVPPSFQHIFFIHRFADFQNVLSIQRCEFFRIHKWWKKNKKPKKYRKMILKFWISSNWINTRIDIILTCWRNSLKITPNNNTISFFPQIVQNIS